jgi:tetrapyrrole methylase family protein/MazG family protein
MPQAPKTLNTFEALVQVVADLRGPQGCPWDREQTHTSLTPYAIEEVHEMAEAIESGDDAHMCEELGDVLFQVVLHAELARERGVFKINDVIESIVSKIVRRHPHVFSDTTVKDSTEVLKNWDEIKKAEKKNKNIKEKVFDVPESLPALQRASKIGEKTEKYKFDWSEASQVLSQLKSEIAELEEALEKKQKPEWQHEMGDVLFSAAQLARHLDFDPEASLREANRRFIARFEKMLAETGSLESFVALSSDEKEQLWKKIKNI